MRGCNAMLTTVAIAASIASLWLGLGAGVACLLGVWRSVGVGVVIVTPIIRVGVSVTVKQVSVY